MTNELSIKVKTLSAAQYGEFISRGKMPAGEEAARRYLGKKQAEKMARIDRVFIGAIFGAWIAFIIAAIVAPFIIFAGV